MSDPRAVPADHAGDCFGCGRVPGAVACTTQGGAEHDAFVAVQPAHLAVAELRNRDLTERDARVERLTRWTGGDREAARAQEEVATNAIAH
ncbi:MAG: hypothetical protein DLM62_05540 [Pseudonocardiales bacterium]|nr:MAG: hypothetical protein DLM62_05540 [Pseudonocardiales bacterium]